ncbi:hypothetical protein AB4Y43_39855 [Paraburkholderia sp. BR10872]|uniref:hypothetical protein n=1 Tax=Paraburkholderia sp. BR10872 TaxID=3236989 RepID=UPI0034D24DDB
MMDITAAGRCAAARLVYFCFRLLLLVAACFPLLPDNDARSRSIAPQRRYLLRRNKMMPTLTNAGCLDAFAKEGVT